MRKKNVYKINNKGLSLIELIVSVLITGILMTAVAMFISTSRNVYMTVNKSATLQEESLTVERVVSEYLMEAVECYCKEYEIPIYDSSNNKIKEISEKVLFVNALENEADINTNNLYCFALDSTDNILRYCKIDAGTENLLSGDLTEGACSLIGKAIYGPSSKNAKYSVIAEHIQDMNCVLDTDTNLIILNLNYNYLDCDYTSHLTVTARELKPPVTVEPDDPSDPSNPTDPSEPSET